MTTGLFQPPGPDGQSKPVVPSVPDLVGKQIVVGAIVGWFLALMILVHAGMALVKPTGEPSSRNLFLTALLIAVLSLGICWKSRTCAVLLLVGYTLSTAWAAIQGQFHGLSLVFLFFFINAVMGTWRYHTWRRQVRQDLDHDDSLDPPGRDA